MVIEDLFEHLMVSFAYLFLFLAQIQYLRYKHSGRFLGLVHTYPFSFENATFFIRF